MLVLSVDHKKVSVLTSGNSPEILLASDILFDTVSKGHE